MCRRTHGITRFTHGIARVSQGNARKSPEDPRNTPVEPRKSPEYPRIGKILGSTGDLPGCFKQFETSGFKHPTRIGPGLPGTSRNFPELQGSTTDLTQRSTDFLRTTQDQTGVARIGGPWRSGARSGKV